METVATARVRYAETDAMGIVYHANYLIWCEMARTELFRKMGIPYTRFEAEGLSLAVVEVNLRLKSPARYDDLLDLQVGLAEIGPRRVEFNYRICRAEKVLCEGRTSHIFINNEGKATSAASRPVWQEVKKAFQL